MRDSLWAVCLGLSGLFAAFAVGHALLLPPGVSTVMTLLASATAVILCSSGVVMKRRPVPARWAHPIALAIACLALLNTLVHFYLIRDPLESTSIALIVIAAGCFLLSGRWLASTMALALSGWIYTVWIIGPSPTWIHFGFMQLGATAISVLVHTVRVRTTKRLHHMHLQDEHRKRELAEAAAVARESEERFRRLAEATFEGIVVHQEGKILDANETLAVMFGYSPTEVVRKTVWDLLHPECRRNLSGEFLTTDEKPFHAAGIKKDGTVFPIEACGKRISLSERSANVLAIRDLTERKRAEEALRQSEERFRLLVEGVKDYAILMLDPQGRVLSWNEGAERIEGYRSEDIIGKHFSVFYFPEDIESGKPEEALKKAAATGRYKDEGWRLRKDGSRFQANVVITALQDQAGTLRGFAKVIRDITERMCAEKARQEAEELARRTKQISLFSQMGSFLQTCLTAEEAYRVIGQFAPKVLLSWSGALCMLNASRNLVEAVANWGVSPTGEQVFAPNDCWALRSGRPHFVDNPQSPVVCPHARSSQASVYLCVPMVAQGDTQGVLCLQTKPDGASHPDAVSPSPLPPKELAIAVAEQIGLALANLRLRETFRTQSMRDAVSGLFNRRYMEECLERELRRAARKATPLGIILLAVHHPKRYSRTFRSSASDLVLHELGNFLAARVRGEDIPCRYREEEFVLILPDASLETALRRAEQLQEEIRMLRIPDGRRMPGKLTLSAGVAVYPQHGTSAQALLRSAEEALLGIRQHEHCAH